MSKVNRGQSRVLLEGGHVRPGVQFEGGQVRTPPSHRRPAGQHPRQQVLHPGEVYHPEPVPKRQPMHQGRPAGLNPPPNRPDIKNLGQKFGGQISITSNEGQQLNRRPLPIASGSSSPKFRSEMSAPPRSTPPQARPSTGTQSSSVPLPIPIQVKEEPGMQIKWRISAFQIKSIN